MSYTKDVTIRCEALDCPSRISISTSLNSVTKSVQMVRRQIRSTGWTYTVERGDRCAYHSKQETS